jgi:subtilase family serine protease
MAILVPGSWLASSEGSPSRVTPALAGPYTEKDINESTAYGPGDLREAYDLPSESAGSGQTVGIVDAFDDPNAESDLAKYRSHFGLPSCTAANGCFRKVNQSGGSTYPPSNAQWAVEISLDLDMVSAVCPKCHILLVEATSNGDIELGEAENEAVALGATELSDSWGGREFFYEAEYNSYFNHPGVPIAVAAGDEGDVVTYPAAAPSVISVGGTVLKRETNARGWIEKAWGGEGKEGTGSGCSKYEPKPAWQTDTGCANRTDNDVAATAGDGHPVWVADSFEDPDETYKVEDPGWTLGGGTSESAPIVAATMALASESTRSLPGAEAFYEEAAQNGTGALDDVVSGNNGTCGTISAKPGPAMTGRRASEAPTVPRSCSQPCSRNRRAAGSARWARRATCWLAGAARKTPPTSPA